MERPALERSLEREWKAGMSTGAVGRELCRTLCRTLGIAGTHPLLKALLEALISESNRQSFDRSCIVRAFREADREAADDEMRRSMDRGRSAIEADHSVRSRAFADADVPEVLQ